MPNYGIYATTATDPYGPTTADYGTSALSTNLLWNTNDNITNGTQYFRWTGSDLAVTGGSKKIPADIKRKKFLAETPELQLFKQPELKLFDDGDCLDKAIAPKIDYDTVKSVGRNANGHIYDVYEVPEKPWDADEEFYKESIEAKGLRKTAMGFYIEDPKVKYDFRFKKIVQLRQPPAFITPRQLSDKIVSPQEAIARALLRRYIGEKEFKRYQRYGYIMMVAHRFVWKVPGERATVHRILQYDKNKVVGSYCVHFSDDKIPPTDACVMRMALINSGIENLKKHSNYGAGDGWGSDGSFRTKQEPAKQLSLMEAMSLVKSQYGI